MSAAILAKERLTIGRSEYYNLSPKENEGTLLVTRGALGAARNSRGARPPTSSSKYIY